MSKCRSQLLVTRLICLILIGACLFFWNAAEREKKNFDAIRKHALWLYPYVPNLKTDFAFTIGFFGHSYSGTYKEDWEVLFSGATEKPDLFFCRDIAKGLKKENTVYVDVGANKGLHSLFLSKYFDTVLAFEPLPALVQSFKSNIEQNQIENIIVRQIGLGSENARVPFFQGDNPFTGSYREDFNTENSTRSEFEVKRGDAELERLGLSPDLIKIDVEGFELPVLKGLKESLNKSRPIVLLELLPSTIQKKKYGFTDEVSLKRAFPEDYRFFEFKDYEAYSGSYSLHELDYEARKKLSAPAMHVYARNIVALPKEKQSLLPQSVYR